MEGIRGEKNKFRSITIGAACLSAVLWVSAGSILNASGDLYSFMIVGILAGLSTVVSVNSARREGLV